MAQHSRRENLVQDHEGPARTVTPNNNTTEYKRVPMDCRTPYNKTNNYNRLPSHFVLRTLIIIMGKMIMKMVVIIITIIRDQLDRS